jgi:hypothetical protein
MAFVTPRQFAFFKTLIEALHCPDRASGLGKVPILRRAVRSRWISGRYWRTLYVDSVYRLARAFPS